MVDPPATPVREEAGEPGRIGGKLAHQTAPAIRERVQAKRAAEIVRLRGAIEGALDKLTRQSTPALLWPVADALATAPTQPVVDLEGRVKELETELAHVKAEACEMAEKLDGQRTIRKLEQRLSDSKEKGTEG